MKNIIRAFVAVLVLTGAAATTQISSASTSATVTAGVAKTSALPIPRCPPNDPNGCGMSEGR